MNHDSLKTLTDEEVMAWARQANADCIKAGASERDSEWHQSCFAAMVVLSREMQRRGISLNRTH